MSTLCRKSSAGLFLRENADAASEREGGRLYNRSPAMHVSCGFICSGDSMSTPSERSSPSVNGWQGEYVESLFAQWQSNPDSVGAEWRDFFRGFELGLAQPAPTGGGEVAPRVQSIISAPTSAAGTPLERKVDRLIEQYRSWGHLAASLDPLGTTRPFPEQLTLSAFGIEDADLATAISVATLPLPNPSTVGEIIAFLEETYCSSIGVEYTHIECPTQRAWLERRMEACRNQPKLSDEQRTRVAKKLIEATAFEEFLATRYVGKKRFGAEGGESLLPMLDTIIEAAPALGITEFAFGMSHRGRLNVLINVMDKAPERLFTEFDESWEEGFLNCAGDVKYHSGHSTDRATQSGQKVRLTLSPNPSHLAFVAAIVLGRTRGKQRLHNDTDRKKVVPLIMHGDAAFAGQGVIPECLNMMRLDGYTVGGAIHLVVNNQVGFTTNQNDSFSGRYCTDIAKGFSIPVFHVNGDDPDACAWVARLAIEWRQTFGTDAIIDLWCYRKYGHNEADEPTFTQPMLYSRVKKQKSISIKFRETLVAQGVVAAKELEQFQTDYIRRLDEAQTRAKQETIVPIIDPFQSLWSGLTRAYTDDPIDTAVDESRLAVLAAKLGVAPEGAKLHKVVQRLLEGRANAVASGTIDWPTAELLAYATLLTEGHPIRITGEDVERGTFSHRHAVVHCQDSGSSFTALGTLADDQARFCIHNSPLIEQAVLGFEYGYSLGDPKMLVIWEAQFGDFVNGAQVIIDQFIASAEKKWYRSSGLVLFLPHGYEGLGPEHSSCRPERFLQMCADDNMIVCQPSTAAQMFHLVRRQVKQPFRKPLIVLTPKSMLRAKAAESRLEAFTKGRFHTVLHDPTITDPAAVQRVMLCAGNMWHQLALQREKSGQTGTALVRLEQFYPFPETAMQKTLALYPNAKRFIWVQEEPRNNGAYRFIETIFREHMSIKLEFIGRGDSPTPSGGSHRMHMIEQEKILIEAVGAAKSGAPNTSSSSTTGHSH
jgi:2-oxoglutarate dehydrogenase E1 component